MIFGQIDGSPARYYHVCYRQTRLPIIGDTIYIQHSARNSKNRQLVYVYNIERIAHGRDLYHFELRE